MIRPQLLLLLGLTALAGCVAPGMGTVSMNMTLSGGEVLRLDFDGKGGIVPEENADVRMEAPLLRGDEKTKLPVYLFSFIDKKNQAPKKVTVEDVSDDVAVTWAVDAQPELKGGRWAWKTHPFEASEKNLQWVYQLDNSVRVFRFTIVTADGRTLVMHGAMNAPALEKTYFRIIFGIEKPVKT